jgi:hypothetical protein
LFDEDEPSAPSKATSISGAVDVEPVISIVQPALCPIYGGIDLTIRGSNFKPGIKVTIGDVVTVRDSSFVFLTFAVLLEKANFRWCRDLVTSLS